MNLTIIPADTLVTINGRTFTGIDMSSIPADIHAVQWSGERGEIEYTEQIDQESKQRIKKANKVIIELEQFQTVIAAFEQMAAIADVPPTFNDLKFSKNIEINRARLAANNTTFTHAGRMFSSDVLSRGDIDGTANHIALFGTFPPDFPGGWKAVDNTIFVMETVEDFKAFYQSMTAQGTANFNHAQTLKAQLAQATTAEQVNAITW